MTCAPIVIKLVSVGMSLWSMTGVPTQVCVYSANGAQWKERQIGIECDSVPGKIPAQVMALAKHNACATP